jgi:hypothetical protein
MHPGGIGEDDPVPPTIPESTKISLSQRLRERQRERWPALATVQVRFRGRFAYVNGQLQGGWVLPLCRLGQPVGLCALPGQPRRL